MRIEIKNRYWLVAALICVALLCSVPYLRQKAARDYFQRGYDRHYTLHDSSGALKCFDSAIKLDPSYGLAYYYRAEVKLKLADRSGAHADFRTAVRLDPNLGRL